MSKLQNIYRFILSLDTRIWVAVATLISFAFGIHRLGDRSIWLDEAYSIYTVQRDWQTFWAIITNVEANQTFYHILLKFWMLLGDDESTLRFLSVIFSTASIPMIYLVGKELFDKNAGVVAAFLLGVNGYLIYYAQEIRGYSFLLFLTICSSYFAVRCIKNSSRQNWTLYVVVNVIATYVHFFAVWIMLAHAFLLLFLPKKTVDWKSVFTSAFFIILFLFPLLLFILYRDYGQISWIWEPGFKSLINLNRSLAGLHYTFHGKSPSLVVTFSSLVYLFLYAIPVVYLIHSSIKNKRSIITWRYAFPVCLLFLPVVLVYWFSSLKHIFHIRYMIIVLPGFLLSAAFTLTRFNKRWMSFLASTVMILAGAMITMDSYDDIKKPNWRGLTEHINSSLKDNDALYFAQEGSTFCFEYYWKKKKISAKNVVFTNRARPYSYLMGIEHESFDAEWVKELSERHKRIWFVMLTWVGKKHLNNTRKLLEKYYIKRQFRDYGSALQFELYVNRNYTPSSR